MKIRKSLSKSFNDSMPDKNMNKKFNVIEFKLIKFDCYGYEKLRILVIDIVTSLV